MRRQQSARIVFVFVFISVFLLILSFFGVLNPPIGGADRFAQEREASRNLGAPNRTDPDEKVPVESSQDQETKPSQSEEAVKEPEITAEAASEPPILPLPIQANDPALLPESEEQQLRLWPQESAVPDLHSVDFDYYATLQNETKPLNGITVILDPSFGGSSTGATFVTDSGVLAEKDIVLQIAKLAERYLVEMGAEVIMTRSSDTENSFFYVAALTADTVLERYAQEAEEANYEVQLIEDLRLQMADVMRINQNNADSGGRGLFGGIGTAARLRLIYDIQAQYDDIAFINISLNHDNDVSMSGAEIRIMDRDFVAETNNSYVEGLDPNTLAPNYTMIDSQSRQELAWLLYGHLQHQTPGLAADAEPRIEQMDMAVLRLNNLTSVSVVPGYLSNEADRNEISSAEGQQKIALALAYAVRQYYVGP